MNIHKPKEVDPKEWKEALARAERAKRYAEVFPSFVKEIEMKFQDPIWQWEHETKGRMRNELQLKD
jgi:hypothetical protein